MAKKSMIAREVKRQKLVEKFAAKRAALKADHQRPKQAYGRAFPRFSRACKTCRATARRHACTTVAS